MNPVREFGDKFAGARGVSPAVKRGEALRASGQRGHPPSSTRKSARATIKRERSKPGAGATSAPPYGSRRRPVSRRTIGKLAVGLDQRSADLRQRCARRSTPIGVDAQLSFPCIPCLPHDPKFPGVYDPEIVGDGASKFAPSLGYVLA